MKIESNRLLVRQLEPGDLNASRSHRLVPEMFKYISEPPTEQQIMQRFNQSILPWQGQDDEKLGIAIVLKTDNSFAGELMFQYVAREKGLAEIGYSLIAKYQGLGMQREAHLVAHNKIAGIDCDTYSYALCWNEWRSEWQNQTISAQ